MFYYLLSWQIQKTMLVHKNLCTTLMCFVKSDFCFATYVHFLSGHAKPCGLWYLTWYRRDDLRRYLLEHWWHLYGLYWCLERKPPKKSTYESQTKSLQIICINIGQFLFSDGWKWMPISTRQHSENHFNCNRPCKPGIYQLIVFRSWNRFRELSCKVRLGSTYTRILSRGTTDRYSTIDTQVPCSRYLAVWEIKELCVKLIYYTV